MHSRTLAAGSVAVILGLLLVGASSARADLISYQRIVGNAAVSGYAGPYVNITVNRTSSTAARITFTSDSVGGNTYLLGDGSSAAVNVNAASWTVGSFSGSNSAGFSPGAFSDGGSGNVDGFGVFNQNVNSFDGYIHTSSSLSFTITDTSGTWASAANVLTPNAGGSVAAAHIFVCAGNGSCDPTASALATGFTDGAVVVPEASTVLLFASGVIGLAALGRRRRT